jgi:hypothetical protein
MMTERDELIIKEAYKKSWTDIDEDEADTPEGRQALHEIILGKYHREEYSSGLDD